MEICLDNGDRSVDSRERSVSTQLLDSGDRSADSRERSVSGRSGTRSVQTPKQLFKYIQDAMNNNLALLSDIITSVDLPSGKLREMSKLLKNHQDLKVRKIAHKLARTARRRERSAGKPAIQGGQSPDFSDEAVTAALADALPSTSFVVSFTLSKPYPATYAGNIDYENGFKSILTGGAGSEHGFTNHTTFYDILDRTLLADEHNTSTDDIEELPKGKCDNVTATPAPTKPVFSPVPENQVEIILDGKSEFVNALFTSDIYQILRSRGISPDDVVINQNGATIGEKRLLNGIRLTIHSKLLGGHVSAACAYRAIREEVFPRCLRSQVPLEDTDSEIDYPSDSDGEFTDDEDENGSVSVWMKFGGKEAYTWLPPSEDCDEDEVWETFQAIWNVADDQRDRFYFTVGGVPLRRALAAGIKADSTIEVSVRLRGGSMSSVVQTAPENTSFEFGGKSPISDMKTCVHAFADAIRDAFEYKPTRVDASSRLAANRAFISNLAPKQLQYNFTQYSQYKTQGDTLALLDYLDNAGNPTAPAQRYTTTLPHPSMAMEPLDITVWGTQVLEAATKEDMNVLTSALRTTNVRLSAQGIIAFTAYMKSLMPESGRGAVFSATSVFLNALGYMISLQSRTSRGSVVGNINWVSAAGMPIQMQAGSWPLSSANAPGAPVINCTAVNLDTIINWLQFGTGAVVGTFDPALIDTNCIIIPVNNDILSNTALLCAWIIIHMEYPFRTFSYQGSLSSDNGATYAVNAAAQPFHLLDRVPGVVDNVILVYTPGQATAGAVNINVNGVPVPIVGNFGAPVDVGTALYNYFALGNYLPYQTAFQTAIRMYGAGSAYDTALWRASLRHLKWKRPPSVTSNPAVPIQGAVIYNAAAPNAPPYNQGIGSWAPNSAVNIAAFVASQTDPHYQIGSLLANTRNLSTAANYQIGLRSSALGLFVALGGAKVAGKAVWPLEANPVVLGERFSRVNQAMVMRADFWMQANSIPAELVYNTGDTNVATAGNYQTLIGPTSTTLDGSDMSTVSDYLNTFTYMKVSMGEMLYRSNAQTLNLYPYGRVTPTSRCSILNGEGYLNELISTDASTDFTAVADASSIMSADLGGNVYARYAPQIPMISGFQKALALRKSLFTGYWDEVGYRMLRWIPNARATGVEHVVLPTDFPGDGVGLTVSLAPFGSPQGRVPDFRELPHGCLQPNFRQSDMNTLLIGAQNGINLFGQKKGREIPNTAALDLVTDRYWTMQYAPVVATQERLTIQLFRGPGKDDGGGKKTDTSVEGVTPPPTGSV